MTKYDENDIEVHDWEEDKAFGLAIAAGFVLGAACMAFLAYLGLVNL